jgi:hypothetical protein
MYLQFKKVSVNPFSGEIGHKIISHRVKVIEVVLSVNKVGLYILNLKDHFSKYFRQHFE